MKIRRATVDDARLLAELNATVQLLHAENRSDIFKPPQLTAELIAWYADLLTQPENNVYIGEVNDEAIGYMVAKVVRRPENPFTYAMDVVYIDQISINMEHQGKGYGKRLLLASYDLAQAENINRIELGVLNFNTQATEFYKQQGFRVYSERMEFELS